MDINDAIHFINTDQSLTDTQKEELLSDEGKGKLTAILSGATGATLGVALAKYKNMSKTAQTILGALGFGAGVLIYKYWTRDRFLKYNSKTKTYDIDNK